MQSVSQVAKTQVRKAHLRASVDGLPWKLVARESGDPQRQAFERYIARRYRRCHDAEVTEFLPVLLALEHEGKIGAALGIGPAAGKRCFLENYLDAPVEQCVSAQFQCPVTRSQIVEIGNLAASQSAASYQLLTLLVAILANAGFRWITFTANSRVQQLISALGFPVSVLGEADPARLGKEAEKWGSYYADRPLVMVGDIARGTEIVQAMPPMRTLLDLHKEAIAACAINLR